MSSGLRNVRRVLPSDLSGQEHKTTKYNQMLYINLLSATVSMVTLLVNTSAQGYNVWAEVVVIALAVSSTMAPLDTEFRMQQDLSSQE